MDRKESAPDDPTLRQHYELRGELGRGGMGIVYRARERSLGREVAIKVPHLSGDSAAERKARFLKEGHSLAQLRSHPHVVAVLFASPPDADPPWLVMTLVEGIDLRTYLAAKPQRRVPLGTAQRWLGQLLEGLAHAHGCGVVHGDLKPANLMITGEEGQEHLVILDFGLARALRGEAELEGSLSGGCTVEYASPEQLSAPHRCDEASDLFAVGVIGFELLTGARPIGALRGEQAAAAVASGQFSRSVRELAPELPESVERWIARALSFDPAARFRSAREMGDELKALARELEGGLPKIQGGPPSATLSAAPPAAPARPMVELAPERPSWGVSPAREVDPPASPRASSGSNSPWLALGALGVGGAWVLATLLSGTPSPPDAPTPALEEAPSLAPPTALAPTPAAPTPVERSVAPPPLRRSAPPGPGPVASAPRTPGEEPAAESPATESSTAALPVGLRWVQLPAGSIVLGADISPGGATSRVTLDAFKISKSEVTFGQYKACVDEGVCPTPATRRQNPTCGWGADPQSTRPVNCVTWYAARTFAQWVGGDLPTEAQWEYAARGPERRSWPWGEGPGPDCERVIMHESLTLTTAMSLLGCGQGSTSPVCTRPLGNTPEGVCDMAGNLEEWTRDRYGEEPPPEGAHNPQGPGSGGKRVVRGGGPASTASTLWTLDRDGAKPDWWNGTRGFRVVVESR